MIKVLALPFLLGVLAILALIAGGVLFVIDRSSTDRWAKLAVMVSIGLVVVGGSMSMFSNFSAWTLFGITLILFGVVLLRPSGLFDDLISRRSIRSQPSPALLIGGVTLVFAGAAILILA